MELWEEIKIIKANPLVLKLLRVKNLEVDILGKEEIAVRVNNHYKMLIVLSFKVNPINPLKKDLLNLIKSNYYKVWHLFSNIWQIVND